MSNKLLLPKDMALLKSRVQNSLKPIVPVNSQTKSYDNFMFHARKTDAGRKLPPYYLCYFLFADLLGFTKNGPYDKTAWSIPFDYDGERYLIEHRKYGFALSVVQPSNKEEQAQKVVKRIQAAVRTAKPYFEWRAGEAAKGSSLNVHNLHARLFARLKYFLGLYKDTYDELENAPPISRETIKDTKALAKARNKKTQLRKNSEWLALSVLDAFFSWTEHVFILMAILKGNVVTGDAVKKLTDKEWKIKFKQAISSSSDESKTFYDELIKAKDQLRNYMAHGAFGKKGEAFQFHSDAGAVPLIINRSSSVERYSFRSDLAFNDQDVVDLVIRFIPYLWANERATQGMYIESGLPIILSMAANGSYVSAIECEDNMEHFIYELQLEFDRAMDMDY